MTGNFDNDLKWRWAKTPEERLLAQAADKQAARPATPALLPTTPAVLPAAPAAADTAADWPGFRGPDRDGIIPGVRIETDWSASPPVELWRRPIGPGWSSFAVHGDLLYTQEQRGGDEGVACYNVNTGKAVWKHRDAARFWESNGGAGPRAIQVAGLRPSLPEARIANAPTCE